MKTNSITILLLLITASVAIAQERAAEVKQKSPRGNVPRVNQQLLEAVNSKLDIPYASTDHQRQQLDLFWPKKAKQEKLPLLVFIHGGAWKNGDKASGHSVVIPFVKSGAYVGASLNYRYSSQGLWPAQIHDCKAAIRWLRGNAKEFGIDPEKIGVIGTSAGGHLVAMLGTSGDVAELEGDLGDFKYESSRVTAVVDYFGPAELQSMSKYPSTIDHDAPNSPEAMLLGGAVQTQVKQAKSASPQNHVSKDDAPFLIIHGTKDPLVPYDQSVQFDKALDAVGVSSTLITIQDGGHGQFSIPKLYHLIEQFFDQHLRNGTTTITETTLTQ